MILQVKSLQEAIEWIKRSPNGHAANPKSRSARSSSQKTLHLPFSEEDIQLEKKIRAQLADQAAKK